MDLRILSFGKFDFDNYIGNQNGIYASGCYFDFVKFKKIDQEKDIQKGVFNSQCYKNVFNERINAENGCQIQENMILLSDCEDDNFLYNSRVIYISIINLSYENESKYAEGNQFADNCAKLKQIIENKINMSFARLYHTVDHCDFVLLCDGGKVSLKKYMKLIQEIQSLSSTLLIDIASNKTIKNKICNITTVYGYNGEPLHIQDNGITENEIAIALNISAKNPRLYLNLDNHWSAAGVPSPLIDIEMMGKYDHFFFWQNANNATLSTIVSIIRKNHYDIWSYLIHIGLPQNTVEEKKLLPLQRGDKCVSLQNQLLVCAQTTFEKHLECISQFEPSLFYALKEIHLSICSLLKDGIAIYYILCFYEAFYCFVEHLTKVKSSKVALSKDDLEQIYDMFRHFFGCLNALNVSTLHTTRQFLRIDSSHLMYFDAPAKIVAFYTSMANKMAYVLNGNSKDHYTFLLTPDFKKEIFVESLTNDRSLGQEHNLLIIHINEQNLYDVPNTLKILAHEIAHHTGQGKDLRQNRSTLYQQSFLAYVLAESFTDAWFPKTYTVEDFTGSFDFFQMFVELLSIELFPADWSKSYEKESIKSEKILHYTDCLIEAFMAHIEDSFSSRRGHDAILKVIEKISKEYPSYYEQYVCGFWQNVGRNLGNDKKAVAFYDFANEKVTSELYKAIQEWLIDNHNDKCYKNVKYAFSESYADARMLMLTAPLDTRAQSYSDMIEMNAIDFEYDDELRIASVFTYLGLTSETSDKIRSFEQFNLLPTDSSPKNNLLLRKCYYLYVRNQCVKYLHLLKDPEEKYKTEIESILEAIQAFEGKDLTRIINCIDKEIFNYRKRLAR